VPVLRFARDQRGYESTYLLDPGRKGSQDSASLLYWFRTPPHVKVGRAAFDEDAIRDLEQQHPGIEFDWNRILTTRPPAAPEPRDPRAPRSERRGPPRPPRRDEPRGKPPATERSFERREPVVVTPAVPAEPAEEIEAEAEIPAPPALERVEPVIVVSDVLSEPVAPVRRFVRVFDQPSEPIAAHHATDPSAAERLLGPELLTVLRARYAEILARIGQKGGEPAKVEALREQAERANPDGWVTDDEVIAGRAAVDGILADLHQQVGRRRRRRRRGGRGRRSGAPASEASGPTPEMASTLEAPFDEPEDEGPDEAPED
jgi:ribonuclease E